MKRRITKFLIGGVLFWICINIFMAYNILVPNSPPPKASDLETLNELSKSYKVTYRTYNYDSLSLNGVQISSPVETSCMIFLIHGYRANYQYMMRYADLFLETGCEVLAFDLPAHGNSEGKVLSWGENESKYLDKLISKYKSLDDTRKVGLFGLSLGGALAFKMASLNKVDFIISDSSYSDLHSIFLRQGRRQYGIVADGLLSTSMWFAEIFAHTNFKKNSPKSLIKEITIPTLVIHSPDDDYTPVSHAKELENIATEMSNIEFYYPDWQSGHAIAYEKNPRKYKGIIEDFLKKIR